MKANCKTCKHRLDLKKWDFKEDCVEHTDLEGFACDLFGYEGVIIWQVGNEDGYCEEYISKDKKVNYLDIALKCLDKISKDNPDTKIIIDLPDNKGGILKIKDILFYIDGYNNLVIDGE